MNLAKVKILIAENGAVVALAVLVLIFALVNQRFIAPQNLEAIVLSMVEVGIIAIPLALLVMSGSIDLSVGSVASLGAVVGGLVITGNGNVWLGILAGVATGVVTGLCNGLLIEYLRLNSLVVTLGFLNVWAGAALFLTNGRTIAGYPPQARELSQWALLDVVPFPMFVLIVVALAAWFFLNYRPFGRRLLATGGNPRAAYLMGIGVHGVRMRLFILTGAGAGLAGVLMSLKLQSAAPTTGSGLEFSALTVVLLGGVAVAGGHGRISGVIAGLLFVGVLRNGLIFLGVSQFLQTMIIGLTLIIAISLDETLQRVMKSAWNRLAKQDASPPAPHPAPLAPVDAGTK